MKKQTVVEYYSQDGSIADAINRHLKNNPKDTVVHIQVTPINNQDTYGQLVTNTYALVIYQSLEEVEHERV